MREVDLGLCYFKNLRRGREESRKAKKDPGYWISVGYESFKNFSEERSVYYIE